MDTPCELIEEFRAVLLGRTNLVDSVMVKLMLNKIGQKIGR